MQSWKFLQIMFEKSHNTTTICWSPVHSDDVSSNVSTACRLESHALPPGCVSCILLFTSAVVRGTPHQRGTRSLHESALCRGRHLHTFSPQKNTSINFPNLATTVYNWELYYFKISQNFKAFFNLKISSKRMCRSTMCSTRRLANWSKVLRCFTSHDPINHPSIHWHSGTHSYTFVYQIQTYFQCIWDAPQPADKFSTVTQND